MGKRPKHLKRTDTFPNLTKQNHLVTSDETTWYNCIAFAFGDTGRKYWPLMPDYYWPSDLPQTETVETFKKLFMKIGYAECEDGNYEEGIEKVAIFADKNGKPTHASRQLGKKQWKSKLGDWFDIDHHEHAVSGGDYGKIVVYMQRSKS